MTLSSAASPASPASPATTGPAAFAAHDPIDGLQFVDAAARERWTADGLLTVRIERMTAAARGRLAEEIDEAIERRLAALGGTSPGIGASGDADGALSDQLFRMRQVGLRTLCIALGSLRAMASASGALEAGDSATLMFWARATRERPVVLLLDAGDEALGVHVTPVPLCSVVGKPKHVDVDVNVDGDVNHGRSLPASPSPSPSTSAFTSTSTESAGDVHPPHPPLSLAGASVAHDDDAWRGWTLALTAARGPQPLVAFERLFTQSYMPLCNAIAAGLGDVRARHAHDEFRRNFARVYTEACPAFAATGKRPRMVLDAPDLAARIGRLHGARTTQLLLVDGMRHDLGTMVKSNLCRALGARGSLTEETLLWSALPTNTARQLMTLARGSEALREAPVSEREPEPLRGRTVETIRRVKIGSRDVYKLDLGEARLREATTHALAALPGVAEAIADVIARHAATLAARTLLFVFGDHGFTVEPDGTTRQGGASPEEVLVPGFAFLIADVH